MEPSQQTEAAMGVFGFVMLGLFGIVFIISFILWLKVLIALFKKEGAGLGILGLICFIYLYIWGWMKSRELNLKSTMIWLTLVWIASIILWFVAVAGFIGIAASNPDFQKGWEEGLRQQQLQQQGETAPQN